MISRSVLLLDRVATLLLAVVLLAGGGLLLWWWSGQSPLLDRSDTSALGSVAGASWWPYASAAGGVVLVLLGLRWIVAHLRRTKVDRLHLSGSGADGTLEVDGSRVAGAAADALSDTVGVRSAKGSIDRDRGQLVAHLTATLEPEADLALVGSRADAVFADLAQVLGRDDVRAKVELKVARRGGRLPRVD